MRIGGARLRTERERKILSHRELAQAARLSPTTVIKLENNEIERPHTKTVRKLAAALDVDPRYILEG